MTERATILVVDDQPRNLRLLDVLGHDVGDTPAGWLTGRRPPSAVEMFMSSLLVGLPCPTVMPA